MESVKKKLRITNFVEYRNKVKSKQLVAEPFTKTPVITSSILNKEEKEFFQERAAIIEYEAGLPRILAEAEAMIMTLEYFRKKNSLNNQTIEVII